MTIGRIMRLPGRAAVLLLLLSGVAYFAPLRWSPTARAFTLGALLATVFACLLAFVALALAAVAYQAKGAVIWSTASPGARPSHVPPNLGAGLVAIASAQGDKPGTSCAVCGAPLAPQRELYHCGEHLLTLCREHWSAHNGPRCKWQTVYPAAVPSGA